MDDNSRHGRSHCHLDRHRRRRIHRQQLRQARHHAPRSARLVVLDKLTYAGHLESLEGVIDGDRVAFVQGDIAERADVRAPRRAVRPAAIVNFAAESHVDRSIDAPGDFVRTNISGTFELLEASRVFLQRRRRGRASAVPVPARLHRRGLRLARTRRSAFTETTPYAPNSPYSASKAAADHLVRAYHDTYGLPTLLTNCSNNYGPYQFPEKLIPLMVLNALDGKPLADLRRRPQPARLAARGRPLRRRSSACSSAGVPGEKYNVGGDTERTNLEMVDAICDALERAAPAAANARLQAAGRGALPRPEGRSCPIARARPAIRHRRRRRSPASSASRRDTLSRRARRRRWRGTSPTGRGARR